MTEETKRNSARTKKTPSYLRMDVVQVLCRTTSMVFTVQVET
jgi:hypothetical protein